MGTWRGGTIVRILGNSAQRNRGWVCSIVIHGDELMQMCANGNPERRNHCEDTREPGAAEPRLGVLKSNFQNVDLVNKRWKMETHFTRCRIGETRKT
ncbi:hypothetical protein RHMOL_Rhmol07G0228100 [Rhododendron molle]|uniref:Uncharacterized protein n=1 Tax=Rhododendron molle TaxID=49168 RepID=A0ACC0N3W1_RHOML|nr:hypothetical protein RHMOL_Rhmol07G0228100 [Rhododendron molle]